MSKSVSSKQIEQFTKQKILSLIVQAKSNTGVLAELRRGIGKKPGELPQLWGYFLESMPENFYGDKEPSRAEWAIYTVLTLYALHQQGKSLETDVMYQEGQTFGKAVANLVHNENDKERVICRFNTIATATSIEETVHYLRGMIQLLRNENIGLDYSVLAGNIFLYQFPEFSSQVRLKWGQDFYSNLMKEKEEV